MDGIPWDEHHREKPTIEFEGETFWFNFFNHLKQNPRILAIPDAQCMVYSPTFTVKNYPVL